MGEEIKYEHRCIVASLCGASLPEICPQADQGDFEPGSLDICTYCQYFGMVHYEQGGPNGKTLVKVALNKHFVGYTFEHPWQIVWFWKNRMPPPEYFAPVDPAKPPECNLDMAAALSYAKRNGKKLSELTYDEVMQFHNGKPDMLTKPPRQ